MIVMALFSSLLILALFGCSACFSWNEGQDENHEVVVRTLYVPLYKNSAGIDLSPLKNAKSASVLTNAKNYGGIKFPLAPGAGSSQTEHSFKPNNYADNSVAFQAHQKQQPVGGRGDPAESPQHVTMFLQTNVQQDATHQQRYQTNQAYGNSPAHVTFPGAQVVLHRAQPDYSGGASSTPTSENVQLNYASNNYHMDSLKSHVGTLLQNSFQTSEFKQVNNVPHGGGSINQEIYQNSSPHAETYININSDVKPFQGFRTSSSHHHHGIKTNVNAHQGTSEIKEFRQSPNSNGENYQVIASNVGQHTQSAGTQGNPAVQTGHVNLVQHQTSPQLHQYHNPERSFIRESQISHTYQNTDQPIAPYQPSNPSNNYFNQQQNPLNSNINQQNNPSSSHLNQKQIHSVQQPREHHHHHHHHNSLNLTPHSISTVYQEQNSYQNPPALTLHSQAQQQFHVDPASQGYIMHSVNNMKSPSQSHHGSAVNEGVGSSPESRRIPQTNQYFSNPVQIQQISHSQQLLQANQGQEYTPIHQANPFSSPRDHKQSEKQDVYNPHLAQGNQLTQLPMTLNFHQREPQEQRITLYSTQTTTQGQTTSPQNENRLPYNQHSSADISQQLSSPNNAYVTLNSQQIKPISLQTGSSFTSSQSHVPANQFSDGNYQNRYRENSPTFQATGSPQPNSKSQFLETPEETYHSNPRQVYSLPPATYNPPTHHTRDDSPTQHQIQQSSQHIYYKIPEDILNNQYPTSDPGQERPSSRNIQTFRNNNFPVFQANNDIAFNFPQNHH